MIKEFIIQLNELEDDVTVTYSEVEEDYVVRFSEALTASQLAWVDDTIQKVKKLNNQL